jgi:hypothetical protein
MDPKLQDFIIKRMESIEHKVDRLLLLEAKIMGGAAVLSVVVTVFIQVLSFIFKTQS